MKYWEALKEMEAGKECIEINGLRYRIVVVDGIRKLQYFDNRCDAWFSSVSSVKSLINLEWKLCEEPGHDFAWAYEQMSQGQHVKRKSETTVFKLIVNPASGVKHVAYVKDSLCNISPARHEATDWVLVPKN